MVRALFCTLMLVGPLLTDAGPASGVPRRRDPAPAEVFLHGLI